MKHLEIIFIFFIVLLMGSCTPDYDVTIPDNTPLGSTVFYIDGEERTYMNTFIRKKTSTGEYKLTMLFDENINNGEYFHRLACVTYGTEINTEYLLTEEESKNPEEIFVGFSQIYDEDIIGWEYQYNHSNDNFFILTQYDTLNHIVSGKGSLKFKRTRKNGTPSGGGIDKCLYIDFAFNDFYEDK